MLLLVWGHVLILGLLCDILGLVVLYIVWLCSACLIFLLLEPASVIVIWDVYLLNLFWCCCVFDYRCFDCRCWLWSVWEWCV